MTFGAPGFLALIALEGIAAIAVGAWLAWRQGVRAGLPALPPAAPLLLPALLLVLAAGFAAFAAARPQIGERDERSEDRGIDLVIALDVSQSMFARDAAPDRIGRAQAEIVALLERLDGDRVGLVVFAGTPFTRSPLTSDLDALARLVEGVDEERSLVAPGSDLGRGIARAQELVRTGESQAKAILVISDGEDHRGVIEETVRAVRPEGIRVYAAGVGTAAGSPVIDVDPETGAASERDRNGERVITRRDDAALRGIARIGGGAYVPIEGDDRPLATLAAAFDGLDGTLFEEEDRSARIERFQVFSAVALALVAAAIVMRVTFVAGRSRVIARLWPLGAAGLFIGALCSTDVADLNHRGNTQYAQADFAGAVSTYRTAQAIDPGRGELYHNAGNALNRQGQYQDAITETRNALRGEDDNLKALAEYALGNHHAGAAQLTEAIEAYKRALLIDPSDEDAKHNLEVLQRRINATPSPSPTPTPISPEFTPTPNGGQDGDQGDAPATSTAASGDDGSPEAGETPDPNATPGAGDGDVTPEELRRALEEALAGIDEEFTVEEALEVLDLIERTNRDQLAEPGGGPGIGGAPDY